MTYETLIQGPRSAFADRVNKLCSEISPMKTGKFLINYCALGVHMTKEVPSWMQRAGESCKRIGLTDVGDTLIEHAGDEIDHHLLMEDDTKGLVSWYNSTFKETLNAKDFLEQPMTPGVVAYWNLHESTIFGKHPYGQAAIEYEIERISVVFGPTILQHCAIVLGADVLNHLSFIKSHIVFDVGHTKYNAGLVEQIVATAPRSLEHLVMAGAAALDAYGGYLEDCYEKT